MSEERDLFDNLDDASDEPYEEPKPPSRFERMIPDRLDYLKDRSRDKEEIVPGITRREARLYTIGLSLFTLIVCGVTFAITAVVWTGREIRFAEVRGLERNVTATQAVLATRAAEVAMQSTATAEAALALITPSPTPTATLDLPPTFTPTATQEGEVQRVFPPPPDMEGRIFTWGGRNPESRTYLPLRIYNITESPDFTLLDERAGSHVTVNDAATRAVYLRFIRGEEVPVTLYTKDPSQPDVDGTGLNQRFAALNVTAFEQPYLSRDGRRLVFVGPSRDTANANIYLYDFETDGAYRLTNNAQYRYRAPAISPDGSMLFAVREIVGGGGSDLVWIRLDTLDETQLTGEQVMPEEVVFGDGDVTIEDSPDWAPDGQRLVFTRAPIDQPGDADIYMLVFGADGGIVGNIPIGISTDDANEIHPVFSPDGAHVVYSANPTDNYDLFIINVNERTKYQLTEIEGDIFPGTWVSSVPAQ